MILRGDPTIEIVGEAGDGEAGLELIAQVSPDVVLMDIRMPRHGRPRGHHPADGAGRHHPR